MKTKPILLLFTILLTYSSGFSQTPMTKQERNFVVKYLNETSNYMTKTLKGLSAEQLSFKPNAESWSVEECLKHIAISEQNLWASFVDSALATDPDPSKRAEVKMNDEQIMGLIESREQRVKTFAPFEPSNKPEGFKSVLKEFKALRGVHTKWVKKTDEDLRNRYATTPFGVIDAYQAILFMAGHTKRHTDQMKEVMASPNFPRK